MNLGLNRRCLLFVLALWTFRLMAAEPLPTPASAPADWLAWQAKRRESIAGTNGWATLVGLHWLAEGPNYAGSDPTNNAVLPVGRAPAAVGTFTRDGQSVTFAAAPGVSATANGQKVITVLMRSDAEPDPMRLQIGELSILVIARGDRLGLRVRDPQSPARLHFSGLKYFPYNPAWRLQGRLERFPQPQTLRVADVLGGTQVFGSPGELVFTHEGKEYRLAIAEEPGVDDYFIIFRDLTAGAATYPSGRFLYVAKADSEGHVTIDFNRAYTPPCAFTAFATCPLPPGQNWLPFPVEAGELKPAGH
jgi:uncharacterized protein (DUF1684 family)